MMRPWMRRMTVEDIAAAKKLSENKSEQELVAMAAASVKKAGLIRIWFLVSCLMPFLVLLAPVIWQNIMPTKMWLWFIALGLSMFLMQPVRIAAQRCDREGKIIALAFWIKKGIVRVRPRQ